MQFRHEVKHTINAMDTLILRQRLQAVMRPDTHAPGGVYHIRSLYFDNADDKALRQKLNGANIREKYRIRLYNHDVSMIRLERKYKCGSLGFKESAVLSAEQTAAIVRGEIDWLAHSTDDVLLGFYARIRNEGLAPKVIVDYLREPFVFDAGNVRVTLDHHIRTGLRCTDLLDPDCITLPVPDDPTVLEVKWDNYLPDIIRDAVALDGRRANAYSKYAACRMYD